MGSPIVRQWHLLALLPRAPRRVDAGSLEGLLAARGLRVHRRTIQRDLVELATVFPIQCDERTKPYAWCWAEDAITPLPADVRDGRVTVRLRVRAASVTAAAALLGARLELVYPNDVPAREDAWLLADADVPGGDRLRRKLLALSEVVEVVLPETLRVRIAEIHRIAAARHARALRDDDDGLRSDR